MPDMLFICGEGRRRSPTAAERLGVETDFAGLSADADERIGPEAPAWGDVVAVMERSQLARLERQAGDAPKGKRAERLDIPDRCGFMQPERGERVVARLGRFGVEGRPRSLSRRVARARAERPRGPSGRAATGAG